MMMEKVMIQLYKGAGGLGGGSPPHDERKSDDSIKGKKSGEMMIEKMMTQCISASAARPHGKSEDSNAGKLIPVKRQPPPC